MLSSGAIAMAFSAASSYMVEISGASSDLTRVTGVATLGGATVVVVPTGTVAKQYTILTATGGIPDTFNPVVSGVSPNLIPSLSYDANNVYLNFALNYGGGPVGVETMAAALSEPRDAIEEIIEPFLIQKGFLQRTPRGRLITAHAFKHLGLAEPTRDASQFGLFAQDEEG